jgi:predicted metal-dependent phosphotriesterase family hydrolase
LKALIDAGYIDRLCPSHDRGILLIAAINSKMSEEEKRLRLNPHGYLYIKKVVLPLLKEMGVPEVTVNRLCISGPQNFFEESSNSITEKV